MQVISVYFQSVPDTAVEIRKFHVADWYAKPAILGSFSHFLNMETNGCCLFVTCSKYGCRQFLPEPSKLFPISRFVIVEPHESIPWVVIEFNEK